LSRIAAAIAALEGSQPHALRAKPPKEKPRKKSSAPAAGKANVIRWMEQVLRQEQGMPSETLRSLVEDELTKAGFSRMGFSLRFKEALADPRFEELHGEVRLR
jgi:hypothetical protein